MGSVDSSNIFSELATLGRRDYMVVGFPYQHQRCEFESRSWRVVLDTTFVIKFILQQVGSFVRVLWFPPPIKLTATIELKYF